MTPDRDGPTNSDDGNDSRHDPVVSIRVVTDDGAPQFHSVGGQPRHV